MRKWLEEIIAKYKGDDMGLLDHVEDKIQEAKRIANAVASADVAQSRASEQLLVAKKKADDTAKRQVEQAKVARKKSQDSCGHAGDPCVFCGYEKRKPKAAE